MSPEPPEQAMEGECPHEPPEQAMEGECPHEPPSGAEGWFQVLSRSRRQRLLARGRADARPSPGGGHDAIRKISAPLRSALKSFNSAGGDARAPDCAHTKHALNSHDSYH